MVTDPTPETDAQRIREALRLVNDYREGDDDETFARALHGGTPAEFAVCEAIVTLLNYVKQAIRRVEQAEAENVKLTDGRDAWALMATNAQEALVAARQEVERLKEESAGEPSDFWLHKAEANRVRYEKGESDLASARLRASEERETMLWSFKQMNAQAGRVTAGDSPTGGMLKAFARFIVQECQSCLEKLR